MLFKIELLVRSVTSKAHITFNHRIPKMLTSRYHHFNHGICGHASTQLCLAGLDCINEKFGIFYDNFVIRCIKLKLLLLYKFATLLAMPKYNMFTCFCCIYTARSKLYATSACSACFLTLKQNSSYYKSYR